MKNGRRSFVKRRILSKAKKSYGEGWEELDLAGKIIMIRIQIKTQVLPPFTTTGGYLPDIVLGMDKDSSSWEEAKRAHRSKMEKREEKCTQED